MVVGGERHGDRETDKGTDEHRQPQTDRHTDSDREDTQTKTNRAHPLLSSLSHRAIARWIAHSIVRLRTSRRLRHRRHRGSLPGSSSSTTPAEHPTAPSAAPHPHSHSHPHPPRFHPLAHLPGSAGVACPRGPLRRLPSPMPPMKRGARAVGGALCRQSIPSALGGPSEARGWRACWSKK